MNSFRDSILNSVNKNFSNFQEFEKVVTYFVGENWKDIFRNYWVEEINKKAGFELVSSSDLIENGLLQMKNHYYNLFPLNDI